MKFVQWLASNWDLILLFTIAIITVYFYIRTYRTVKDAKSGTEASSTHPDKNHRFWLRNRSVLGLAVLIVVVSGMTFSILTNRIQLTRRPSFKAAVEISATLTVEDDVGATLAIRAIKTTLIENSSYTVDVEMTYKDQEKAMFTDAHEGAIITFPSEGGYTIEVVVVRENRASFSITKK